MKQAWKARHSTTSTAAIRALGRTRAVYASACAGRRTRSRAGAARRVALGLAALIAVCASAPAGAATGDEANLWQEQIARAARAASVLGQPLTPSERHPWLRLFSHFGGSDAEPHLAAIQTLSATGLPASAFALIAVLQDASFPYRVEAAQALASTPHTAAIEPLLSAMQDPDPELRSQAALSLGAIARAQVAPAQAIDPVSARLRVALAQDASSTVHLAAFIALLEIGRADDFGEAFRLAARDSDALMVCETLSSRDFFAKLSEKPDALEGTRSQARKIFKAPESERTLPLLTRALDRSRYQRLVSPLSPCPDTPVMAAHTLAHLEDPSATAVLSQLASSSSDAPLRAAAVLELGRLGGEPGFAAAAAALDDERWSVRRSGIEALAELDEPRAQALLAHRLATGSPLERQAAALALAKIPAQAAALVAAFGDPVVQVRVAAENALLERPKQVARYEAELTADERGEPDDAAPAVSEEKRLELRRSAAEALADWRAAQAEAEQALAAALSAPDERVRHRAARVLASYPGDASLALLLEALRSGRSPAATFAAFGLGLRGDPAAREALAGAASTGEPALALASARALRDLDLPAAQPERR
jgi:HEAT repeat protein